MKIYECRPDNSRATKLKMLFIFNSRVQITYQKKEENSILVDVVSVIRCFYMSMDR